MRKMLVLFIMCAVVAPSAVAIELLENGDFQIGTPKTWHTQTPFDCPGWARTAENGLWLADSAYTIYTPILAPGEQVIGVNWHVTSLYQDFAVDEGTTLTFSLDLYCLNATRRIEPSIRVEFYDVSDAIIGVQEEAARYTVASGGADDQWDTFSGQKVSPAGAVKARYIIDMIQVSGSPYPADSHMMLDNASVQMYLTEGPDPDDNSDVNLNTDPITEVSWLAAELEPNMISIDGYDVYWSVGTEPNYLNGPVSSLQGGTTFDPTDHGLAAITFDSDYFWRVDTHVTWDSNEITGNFTDVFEGDEWQFTTLSAYLAPVIAAYDNVITVQEILPALLSANVTDNSDPITSATFTLLIDDPNYFPPGANASVTNPPADLQNPTTELTTDTAGDYKVKLAVSDGTSTIEAIAVVNVYASACDAKKAAPSGWTGNHFDTNDDCIVDLIDFADMAGNWLNSTAMTDQENY